MRTDVKLGVVISATLVLVVGGYFVFRDAPETPVPLADASSPRTDAVTSPKPGAKLPATSSARSKQPTKEAAPRTTTPMNPAERDPRTATKAPPSQPNTIPVDRAVSGQPPTIGRPDPAASRTEPKPAATAPRSTLADRSSPTATTAAAISPTPKTENPPLALNVDPALSPVPLTGSARPDSATSSKPIAPSPAVAGPQDVNASPGESNPASPTATGSPVIRTDTKPAAVDSHRVQPGDTLATLAKAYYGNAKYATFLGEANPDVRDPNRLPLGAIVKIPALPADIDSRITSAPPAPAKPASTAGTTGARRTYKVQAGDSFYRIARDQLGNAGRWKEIFALNKQLVHGDPTQLQVGQVLVLPES